jgi:hypothetical protein
MFRLSIGTILDSSGLWQNYGKFHALAWNHAIIRTDKINRLISLSFVKCTTAEGRHHQLDDHPTDGDTNLATSYCSSGNPSAHYMMSYCLCLFKERNMQTIHEAMTLIIIVLQMWGLLVRLCKSLVLQTKLFT